MSVSGDLIALWGRKGADEMQQIRTVHFRVDPEGLTNLIREIWAEGRYAAGLGMVDSLMGLPREEQLGVIRGTHKLIERDGEQLCVADDWQPRRDWCFIGQYPDPEKLAALAEKGAKLERDVTRLEDLAIGMIKRLMREGRGDGEVLEDLRHLLNTFPEEALNRHDIEYRWPLGEDGPGKLVYGNWDDGYTSVVPRSDTMLGAIDLPSIGLPNVEDYVAWQLDLDKKPLPPVDVKYESKNGYVTPDGRYYPCGWMEHAWLAFRIEEVLHIPEAQLIKIARSQITPDVVGVYLPSDDYEPSVEQIGIVALWCAKHNVELPEWAEPVKE